MPFGKRLSAHLTETWARGQVALQIESVVDGIVGGQEVEGAIFMYINGFYVPEQYWRCQPNEFRNLFKGMKIGHR